MIYIFCDRLRGRPVEQDWPSTVTLPWTSFQPFPQQPISSYVPEMDSTAAHLLDVCWILVLKLLLWKLGGKKCGFGRAQIISQV